MHLKINVQRVITTIFKLNDNGHFLRFGQLKKLIYIAGMDRWNRRKLKMSWYMYDESCLSWKVKLDVIRWIVVL